MTKTVQVRDVPDDVHAVLRTRAAATGLSLSEYLRREVSALARRPSMDEFLAHIATRPTVAVPTRVITAAVRADRR